MLVTIAIVWLVSLIIITVALINAPLMEEDENGNYYQVQKVKRKRSFTKVR